MHNIVKLEWPGLLPHIQHHDSGMLPHAEHFKTAVNLIMPTGYVKHQQFNIQQLCPHCIYVFCISLRTNSDFCHLQHKLIGFYNRDEKCLQRGTDWGFK